MNEDRLQILKMIENGTITAEEGMKLLSAVESSSEKITQEEEVEKAIRGVHVTVYDPFKAKKVDITLPAGLFRFMGAKVIKEVDSDIDVAGVIEAIKSGKMGEILNIVTDDGHKVIVTVE